MAEREISAAPTEGLVALTAFNRPVYESHAVLTDVARRRLGERHAQIFARPRLSDGHIAWTSSAAGPIRRWQELAQAERATLDPRRAALGQDLAALAEDLTRAGVNTREGNLGHLLRAAMEIPSDAHLYAVGDQPVLAFWGFRSPDGASVNPFAARAFPAASTRWRRIWLWGLILLLVPLALMLWFWWPHPAPVTPPVVTEQDAAPTPPEPVPVPPPPLQPVPSPVPPQPGPPPPIPSPTPPRSPATSPPPPPHAGLPANRWNQRDLSLLKGCWTLGREGPAQQYDAFGHVTDHGITRAGRICFDGSGHGERSSEQDYSFGIVLCTAPITANFDASGRLVTQQPPVRCRGSRSSNWLARTMTCTRRNDEIADCIDRNAFGAYPFEFRRAP